MADRGVARVKGFGLLDIILSLIVLALLAALAVPVYGQFISRVRIATAIEDIDSLAQRITAYRAANEGAMPVSLDALPGSVPKDPWGNDYRYALASDVDTGSNITRKNNTLGPLNTDFDLYSLGADGESSVSLRAASSRDDVVRASNGVFIGLGEEY